MTSRPLHIRDIDDKTGSWSIKVVVYDKSQKRQSASSPWRYQRITFMDAEGEKIVATIFGSDINLFIDTFKVHSTYTISNAKITRIADKYVKSGHPYQWTINKRTAFQFESDNILCSDIIQEFVSLSTVGDFTGQRVPIDLLAIVIAQRERRCFMVGEKEHVIKEYALMSKEQVVVILTLWNNVAESEGNLIDDCKSSLPVISASALIASSYYGVSLGSTISTVVVVDPDIPAADSLRLWRDEHIKPIADIVASKDHFARIDDCATLSVDSIYSIAEVITAVVRVGVTIMDREQKYFYMGCTKCHSAVNADYNYTYTCSSCKESTCAFPRKKIVVNIFDDTGNLDVTAFGAQAVHILEQNSIACMEQYNEGFPLDVSIVNRRLEGKLFFMKIRQGRWIKNTADFQYSVQAVQPFPITEAGQPLLSDKDECSTSLHSSASKKLVFHGAAKDAPTVT